MSNPGCLALVLCVSALAMMSPAAAANSVVIPDLDTQVLPPAHVNVAPVARPESNLPSRVVPLHVAFPKLPPDAPKELLMKAPRLEERTGHKEKAKYQPIFTKKCTVGDAKFTCGTNFACISGKCGFCRIDQDCGSSEIVCRPNIFKKNHCTHKRLFPNFDRQDFLSTILIFIGGFLAAGGGIGGGGLFVPIFILVSGFGAHMAVPLSKSTIFGGAIANFLLNYQKHNPRAPQRPMIDYDVALILEPMTLAGTIIGVMMNVLFPAYLIVMLLVTLLGFTSLRTLRKAMKVHEAEEAAKVLHDEDEDMNTAKSLLVTADGADDALPDEVVTSHLASNTSKGLMLFGVWCLVFCSSIIRGGHGAPSVLGVKCGTWKYWLATGLVFPLLLTVTYFLGVFLHKQHETRKSVNHSFVDGDIHWTTRNTIIYPLMCMVAGIAAGLLGIGGGMVKGPLLLEMGVLPLTTAATSAFMILFTASATTMQFIILGMLPWDYALWYSCITFLATFLGQIALYKILERYQKASVVIFIIGTVIAISTFLMGYVGAKEVYDKIQAHVPMGFNPLCHR